MNIQKIAKQALSYLESLKVPLPCDQTKEGKKWYEQNEKNYQYFLKLGNAGYSLTEESIKHLIKSPMHNKYAKTVVNKMEKIENKISELTDQIYAIENNNKYIEYPNGLGNEAYISYRGHQKIKALNKKIEKLHKQYSDLKKTVTYEQACNFFSCIDLVSENEGYLNAN